MSHNLYGSNLDSEFLPGPTRISDVNRPLLDNLKPIRKFDFQFFFLISLVLFL